MKQRSPLFRSVGLWSLSFLAGLVLSSLGLYLSAETLAEVTPGVYARLTEASAFVMALLLLFLIGISSLSALAARGVVRFSRGSVSKKPHSLVTLSLFLLGASTAAMFVFTQMPFMKVSHPARIELNLDQIKQGATFGIEGVLSEVNSVKGESFKISRYQVPGSYVSNEFGDKASGWLTSNSDYLYLVQGDGSVLTTPIAGVSLSSIALKAIPSNLDEILPSEVFLPGKFGVRGAHVTGEALYLAVTIPFSPIEDGVQGQPAETCPGLAIYSATISAKLTFREIFSPTQCPRGHRSELLESGGGISVLANESDRFVYFSYGTYRDRKEGQNESSHLGSILEIDLSSLSVRTVAIGVRNPQELILKETANGHEMYFIEQGPMGGDEINRFYFTPGGSDLSPKNFGWPIASYGLHYGGRLEPDAPLLEPHKSLGFEEPLYFWRQSVAPAGMTSNPLRGGFAVSTLGTNEAEGDMSILLFSDPLKIGAAALLNLEDIIPMGERIRDLEAVTHGSSNLFFALTDSGDLISFNLER